MLCLVSAGLAFSPSPVFRPSVAPAIRTAAPNMGVVDVFTSVKVTPHAAARALWIFDPPIDGLLPSLSLPVRSRA